MADVATLVFDIDSTAAGSAARELLNLSKASVDLANKSAKLYKMQRDTDGKFISNAEYAKKNADAIENLARSYNPLMAAELAYAKEVQRTAQAVQLNVMSETERAATLARTKIALNNAATAQLKFGQAAQVATHHATNLGFQLNDIGMMMSLGQNPFSLMMQQGPQVAQIFSQMNAEGRKIGPTLIRAFTGMLNPTTAITLAVIGGSAALVQWGMSAIGAGSDSRTFKDAVSDAESAIAKLNDASKLLSTGGLTELQNKYGAVTAEVRALVEQERLLALSDGSKKINEALGKITSTLGEGLFTSAYGDLENIFNVTSNSAQILYGVLQDIGKQDTLGKQLASIEAMKLRLSDATNGFQKMNDKQAEMLRSLTEAESLIRQQQRAIAQTPAMINASTQATEAWKSAMAGVLSYVNAVSASLSNISGGQIKLASIKAETELLKQGKTLREASAAATVKTAELEGAQRTKQLELQYGFMGKILGIAEKNQALSVVNAQNELDIAREVARKRESESKGGGGAGKAAAELKAAEKGFQSLQELMQKESMFQTAEYEKRQAQLETALNKKLITEKTYQDLRAQLQMVYFGSEYEKNQVQYQMDLDALNAAHDQKLLSEEQYQLKLAQLRWKHADELQSGENNRLSVELNGMANGFAQMNELAGGGYDQLLRAQKIFSAASALMSTYTGAAKALELPFPQNLIAMGKVLAAGFGLVSAIKGGGGGGGSGGGGAASTATSAAATTKTEPTKNILVNLTGPDFLVDMAESIIQQIYDQSKDGRVIVSRG